MMGSSYEERVAILARYQQGVTAALAALAPLLVPAPPPPLYGRYSDHAPHHSLTAVGIDLATATRYTRRLRDAAQLMSDTRDDLTDALKQLRAEGETPT